MRVLGLASDRQLVWLMVARGEGRESPTQVEIQYRIPHRHSFATCVQLPQSHFLEATHQHHAHIEIRTAVTEGMEAKEAFSQPFVCQLPALAQNELGMLVRSFVSFFFLVAEGGRHAAECHQLCE